MKGSSKHRREEWRFYVKKGKGTWGSRRGGTKGEREVEHPEDRREKKEGTIEMVMTIGD